MSKRFQAGSRLTVNGADGTPQQRFIVQDRKPFSENAGDSQCAFRFGLFATEPEISPIGEVKTFAPGSNLLWERPDGCVHRFCIASSGGALERR